MKIKWDEQNGWWLVYDGLVMVAHVGSYDRESVTVNLFNADTGKATANRTFEGVTDADIALAKEWAEKQLHEREQKKRLDLHQRFAMAALRVQSAMEYRYPMYVLDEDGTTRRACDIKEDTYVDIAMNIADTIIAAYEARGWVV